MQALVVPLAAEVAGRVIRVLARNNQMVEAGAVLFEVAPERYQIAVDPPASRRRRPPCAA